MYILPVDLLAMFIMKRLKWWSVWLLSFQETASLPPAPMASKDVRFMLLIFEKHFLAH